MYKYALYNKEKFVCPSCGQANKYQRYVDISTGSLIDYKYGRCDREDTCQYWVKPDIEYVNESQGIIKPKVYDLYFSDSLDSNLYIEVFHLLKRKIGAYMKLNLNKNNFVNGLMKRFDNNLVRKAYKDYKLGMCFNNSIIFPYYFNNELKTGKVISYSEDLHRNKNVNPNWLHSIRTFFYFNIYYANSDYVPNILFPKETKEFDEFIENRSDYTDDSECDKFDYCIPIFGWDLLSKKENKDKTICLVEAEKTAIICSIVFPEFVWLASGGKSFLQSYKFVYYSNRNWLIFPDLSTEDKTLNQWRESINKIKCKYNMNETFIDYKPKDTNDFNSLARLKGLDIADYILDYHFKCGEYSNYIEYMKSVLEPFIAGYKTEVIQPIENTIVIPEIKQLQLNVSNTSINTESLIIPDILPIEMNIIPPTISAEQQLENLKIDSGFLFNEPYVNIEYDLKDVLPDEWFLQFND